MSRPDLPALIDRKRRGGELSREEIGGLVPAFMVGEVPDAQMAALLMAGVIRGFSRDEAVALTEAMVASGERVDLTEVPGPTVDKHSTGGVADTVSLVAVPVMAACGLRVAKLSGRALGHTGGTIDKLESIPGLRVDLSRREVVAGVADVGLVIAAATEDLVPADHRLYALRDLTATVASPALIAASIMSKKLAGGAEHLVLDVKAGDGAFLPQVDEAVALAELCVSIGRAHGRAVTGVVSDMSQPLGPAIGNALEVAAAVDVLRGEAVGQLAELSLILAAAALELTGAEPAEARRRAEDALEEGRALESLRSMVRAQGGDHRVVERPREVLPRAPVIRPWEPRRGVVTAIACRRTGELVRRLGAGRTQPGQAVDPAVGLELPVRVGDRVGGEPAGWVHARTEEQADGALARLDALVEVGEEEPAIPPLIHRRVD